MKLKVTNNISYLEAKKLHENKPETTFSKIVQSIAHQSLNSSKGIIRDRMLKGEKEEEIVDYLREQGVTACKRFKI